jgi:hypothetical protein
MNARQYYRNAYLRKILNCFFHVQAIFQSQSLYKNWSKSKQKFYKQKTKTKNKQKTKTKNKNKKQNKKQKQKTKQKLGFVQRLCVISKTQC